MHRDYGLVLPRDQPWRLAVPQEVEHPRVPRPQPGHGVLRRYRRSLSHSPWPNRSPTSSATAAPGRHRRGRRLAERFATAVTSSRPSITWWCSTTSTASPASTSSGAAVTKVNEPVDLDEAAGSRPTGRPRSSTRWHHQHQRALKGDAPARGGRPQGYLDQMPSTRWLPAILPRRRLLAEQADDRLPPCRSRRPRSSTCLVPSLIGQLRLYVSTSDDVRGPRCGRRSMPACRPPCA